MIPKISRWFRNLGLTLGAVTALAGSAGAAPYPKDGQPTHWQQPDGTGLALRVFGDELYGRTTTEDGYTVLFNESEQAYYYAVQDEAKALVPSKAVAGKSAPPAVAKNLKESTASIQATRAANTQKYVPERTRSLRELNPAAAPVIGSKVGLAILVQFPDKVFPTTKAKIERFCNEVGYNDDGNTGSIRDYYSDQSMGQLIHTQLVSTVVTLPNPRNYYNFSNYPTNTLLRDSGEAGRLLLQDSVAKLKTDGFDFSTLSKNSLNQVIATSLLFAGQDSGVWSKGLWPHSYYAATAIDVGTTSNPLKVYRYQCTNVETAAPTIGTISHELGHLLLGYPDLYDTDASDGDSEGVGEHCLMGSGNYLNNQKTPSPIDLYLKSFSGWATITDITPDQLLDTTLPSTGNVGYRIKNPAKPAEYFLIENRGAGDKWATYSDDKGLAIWHIDESVTTDNQRQQMTPTQHYEVSLEQADGAFDLENGNNRGDTGDLFDNTTDAFDDYTNPNAQWWSGLDSGISIKALTAPGATIGVRFGATPGAVTLGVTPGVLKVAPAGGAQTVLVNGSSTWTWSGAPSWITTTEEVSQSGRQSFEYTVAPNTGVNNRIAVLTFTSGSITRTHTVTQLGITLDDHGNTKEKATLVQMASTTEGAIETAGDVDFFRIDVNSRGILTLKSTGGSDMVGTLYNSSGTEITHDDDTIGVNFSIQYTVGGPGTYYLKAGNYYSTQTGTYQIVSTFAASADLSIAPAQSLVAKTGANGSFNVVSTGRWGWTSNVSWITINEASPQTGNQVFSYSVSANTGPRRTGVITLSGTGTATYTITQEGIDYPDLMDPALRTKVSPAKIFSGSQVKIEADVKNAGLVPSGPFVVRYYLSKNDVITGTDTLIGQKSFTGLAAGETAAIDTILGLPALDANRPYYFGWIYDAGAQVTEGDETNNITAVLTGSTTADYALTVAPATQAMPAAAGNTTVTVSSNSQWAWSSNAAWLTSFAAAAQFENQSLTYFVSENTGATPRTGTLTFSTSGITRTVVITQAAKPIPLVVTTFQKNGDNVALGFQSEVGKSYRVMTSTTLQAGSWTVVPGHSGIAGTGSPISRSMTGMGIPAADGKRFFRIEQE
jgi:M6 family metalloprotease-like protein